MMLLMSIPMMGQERKPKDPDHATYVIKGVKHNDVRGDRMVYWLDNVIEKNIWFEKQNMYSGVVNENTQKVSFVFKHADTRNPNKFNDRIILWRKDKDGVWRQDAEKTENRQEFQKEKIMSIMLVLDCSGSMTEDGSDNFSVMQSAVLDFLSLLYNRSNKVGNIHVGVIGFNTTKYADLHTLEPLPLNVQNYSRIYNYINNLQSVKESGTAYYYSLDKAVDVLEKHYNSLSRQDLFSGASIVGFSDGKDNLSMDIKKRIVSTDQYLEHLQVSSNFCGRKIGSQQLDLHAVCFLGKNVDNAEWKSMLGDTRSIFNCTNEDRVKSVTNINALKAEFENIANGLIDKHMDLVCQVPAAIVGDVAWTIEEYDYIKPAPVVVEKPKKARRPIWFGLSLDLGTHSFTKEETSSSSVFVGYDYWGDPVYSTSSSTYEYESSAIYLGMTLDFAISLNNRFAIGPTASIGMIDFEELRLMLGPLAKFTFDNNSAILASLSLGVMEEFAVELRAGYKFKSPFYITAAAHFGAGSGVGIGVGWSFGGKR